MFVLQKQNLTLEHSGWNVNIIQAYLHILRKTRVVVITDTSIRILHSAVIRYWHRLHLPRFTFSATSNSYWHGYSQAT